MFNPGELDKTRRNLGNLSPEESRRMAGLLGGEIGVERDDTDLSEKYARLRAQSRRRTDIPAPAGKSLNPSFREDTAQLEPADEKKPGQASAFRAVASKREKKPAPQPPERPPYWARVRMNFLAAGT